jgi:hypothetical protein
MLFHIPASGLDEHGLVAGNAPGQSITFPSNMETLLLLQVPAGTHTQSRGPGRNQAISANAVISAIVHCVGDVAHWNERNFSRQGVVVQGWLLRASAHSIAHAECTLGSNREALLARLLRTVALFGFTASPLHPFAKAIAQVDATMCRCRFCHPGESRVSVQITPEGHERIHSLDRSQLLLTGLQSCLKSKVRIYTDMVLVVKRQGDPSAQIMVMQVSDGCLQVMLRSQMIHAGTLAPIPWLQSSQIRSRRGNRGE